MRVGAARTIAIARQHTRRLDRDVSPIVAHRRSNARAGLQIGIGGVAFFVAYVTLQLLHAFGRDPQIVEALGSIPLFSRLVASTTCALVGGLSIGFLVRDPTKLLRRLPALLATAIALFVIAVVFFS
jgi:hypothetical protein